MDNNVSVLLLGTIPNLDDEINPLKCFIKKINCRYSKINDFKNRNLKKYILEIENFIKSETYKDISFLILIILFVQPIVVMFMMLTKTD